jgi:hypothetical protein
MLVCLGESALISIGREVGDHPSKEVSVSPTGYSDESEQRSGLNPNTIPG